MLYMGGDGGGGVAYNPVICGRNNESKLSLCFFSTSYAMTAEIMGHEIGHNLGWAFVKRKISQFSHIFSLTREKLTHKKSNFEQFCKTSILEKIKSTVTV